MSVAEPEELRIVERVLGHGHVESGDLSAPVARFALSRTKYDPSAAWEVDLVAGEADRTAMGDLLRSGHGILRLTGTTSSGQELEIPTLSWRRWSGGVLSATTRQVVVDAGPAPMTPARQRLTMQLTPTPLAVHGSEDSGGDDAAAAPPPWRWQSSLGSVAFAVRYLYDEALVGGTRCTVRIPVPTFSLNLERDAVTREPRRVVSAFVEEADAVLRLLSFLGRRHVSWSSISVTSVYEDAEVDNGVHRAQWLRGGVVPRGARVQRPMLDPARVDPEQFAAMSTTLQESQYKDLILVAMMYLVSVGESTFVEGAVANAFTALETITNGINRIDKSDKTLGKQAFAKLASRLRQVIRDYGEDRKLDGSIVDRIVAKVPELNRPPIVERVSLLIESIDADWRDLWPAETDLRGALTDVFKRRNEFLHMGVIASAAQGEVDAQRLRALAERVVFRMLGGRSDWLDPAAYEHLRFLASLEPGSSLTGGEG